VSQLIQNPNEQVIVFRNQRGPAQGCAGYLANELGLPPATETLQALPGADLSTTSTALRRCLAGGTAFHNTNLTREERQAVERGFRDPKGNIRVLAATTTVAAGINTPASTVIIAEQEFIGEDGRPFTVAEYKNMAGRAGRLGFKEKGRSIILADNSLQRTALFNRYVRGTLEALRSSFDPEDLDTWLLRLLGHIKTVPRTEVVGLLIGTYGGYLANRRDSAWRAQMSQTIEALLGKMIELGLVEEEGLNVHLTLLGRACATSTLSFRSALRLVEVLRSLHGRALRAVDLMGIIQVLPELDEAYTPVFRKGTREAVRVNQAAQHFARDLVLLMQDQAADFYVYYARCKRAAILADWIAGKELQAIEQTYSTTPFGGAIGYGDVRRFADSTRFHLRPAYQIASLIFLDKAPNQEAIDSLLKQLEMGIPAELLGLLDLPMILTRGDYLKLAARSVHAVAEFWKLTDEEIIGVLGEARGKAMARRRPTSASSS
jgi:replicative superfamily II helicase